MYDPQQQQPPFTNQQQKYPNENLEPVNQIPIQSLNYPNNVLNPTANVYSPIDSFNASNQFIPQNLVPPQYNSTFMPSQVAQPSNLVEQKAYFDTNSNEFVNKVSFFIIDIFNFE
jgi:hypothetical protein